MDIEKGKLYICATPIGNLEDMTVRVADTLKKVDLIAAEDTRNSMKLLNHFGIRTPLTSYHEFNKYDKADELVRKLKDGASVAVITDAGTPCISDPGEVLIGKCIEAGIPVTSLPGPSAVITALTLSGLPTDHFYFHGFLPPARQKKERRQALEQMKEETATMVLYEAPHHLTETLRELAEVLGEEHRVVLCRELTKVHEEIIRTTLREAVLTEPRGEYVLVLEGRSYAEKKEEARKAFDGMSLEEHLERYLQQGLDRKEAMKKVASDRGLLKRDVYNALLG